MSLAYISLSFPIQILDIGVPCQWWRLLLKLVCLEGQFHQHPICRRFHASFLPCCLYLVSLLFLAPNSPSSSLLPVWRSKSTPLSFDSIMICRKWISCISIPFLCWNRWLTYQWLLKGKRNFPEANWRPIKHKFPVCKWIRLLEPVRSSLNDVVLAF